MTLDLETRPGAVRFRIKVQPRARRRELLGPHAGLLRVRVVAPPVNDRANREALDLLAQHLRIPRSSIKIAAGARAPIKLVEVTGLDAATVIARLLPAEPTSRARSGGPG